MDIKTIVKDNIAKFSYYRDGMLIYDVIDHETNSPRWTFPVDIRNTADIGNASFPSEIKAITLMRYIRKAIDSQSIVEYARG